MSDDKICPIMSRPSVDHDGSGLMCTIPCQGNGCQLWIEVYTTEGIRTEGCAHELGPQMNSEGQLRV